ncbi:MAG: polyisoprenoid-binding protein [Legionellales bacterium]|nr:polyisoprenoid-binding protein [Legionellales bacterium]
MKNTLLVKVTLLAALVGSLCTTTLAATTATSIPASSASEQVSYTLDPSHTYVLWHINHFGFSNPSGKWMTTGTMVFDQKHPAKSSVSANIQLSGLVTGVPELDQHLQEPLFFDVKQYPTAHFESTKVTVTGSDTANVQGNLTLHGVTKPVILHVKLNKIGINPITNNPSIGFSATATLKRSDFGITTLLPGISDTVQLDIQAEAYSLRT